MSSPSSIGRRSRWRGRLVFAGVALVFLVAAPVVLSDFRLNLLAKYLCFAIVAVGIGLAWGQGGMLTLGQGVFFGLGAYAMAMHLKLQEAGPGRMPDFMSWSGVEKLPALWKPFRSAWVALPAAVLLPTALAVVLGLLVFRRRVRGAYFAILTQALAGAFVILVIGQQGYTGGTNGLTNIRQLFGYDLGDPRNQLLLYLACAVALGAAYLGVRQLVASRFGRILIATRDAEDRVRFLGYNPALVKVVAFGLSAAMAGIAGALFVPVVGIVAPAQLGIVPSIEMVVWVALGGRTALAGPILGAILANYAKTSLSEQFPSGWLYLQGAMFVGLIAFAPKGIVGIAERFRRRRASAPEAEGTGREDGEGAVATDVQPERRAVKL